MSTTPNMSLVLPTLGGDDGEWDAKLNTALGLVDEHDHTAGKGKRIKTAAISIDDDLSFAGNDATNVGGVAFTEVAALASGASTIFVSSSDHELYWRTSGGTNVKLTSGASINTSLVGGIVGDYTAVSAEVSFDDSNKRYTFKDGSTPKKWARLAAGEVRIYETSTSVTAYVGLKSPSGLAASYSLEMPGALPSRTSPVTMSATGAVVADDTERTLHIPGCMGVEIVGTIGGQAHLPVNQGFLIGADTTTISYPIPLMDGCLITGWKIYIRKMTNGSDTVSARLFKNDDTSNTQTALGSLQSNSDNAPGYISLSETGLSEVIPAGTGVQHFLKFNPGGATAANHNVMHVEVTYRRA